MMRFKSYSEASRVKSMLSFRIFLPVSRLAWIMGEEVEGAAGFFFG